MRKELQILKFYMKTLVSNSFLWEKALQDKNFAESYRARHARGEEPESLDKEYVRRWLAAQGFTGDGEVPALTDSVRIEAAKRYVEAFERITGTVFVADLRPPAARIEAALAAVVP